jgi:hypothetical protein
MEDQAALQAEEQKQKWKKLVLHIHKLVHGEK